MFSRAHHIHTDLSPSDLHLFPYLKTELSGQYITSLATVKDAVLAFFQNQAAQFYYAGLSKLSHDTINVYIWVMIMSKNNAQLLACKYMFPYLTGCISDF